MKKYMLAACTVFFTMQAAFPQMKGTTPVFISPRKADAWVATDGLGRSIAPGAYPAPRPDRYVGIFYFIWQGAHGYDRHGATGPGGGIVPKTPGDTVSPYDITQMLAANPQNPAYGPVHAFHYWGEPYFGYYLADDEWVIRKHAQMLTDVGVDVIIFDVTNAAIYLPQVTKIVEVYRKLRAAGESAPSIAFIVNSEPKQTVRNLYEQIYQKGLFKDLWFYWKGKPLLLCPPEAVTPDIAEMFEIRQSWAWTKGHKWFADGKDKWPWLDHAPQNYGWHESKDKPEQVSVSVAQHPVSNIGRSFHNGSQPEKHEPEKGLYFEEQWRNALKIDPEFVFVTGWNEWVAMRFLSNGDQTFLGKVLPKGGTFFVDLYNAEYSRDAEPANAVTQDHYYYQLADYIRRFKGARTVAPVKGSNRIAIDGNFADWGAVQTMYTDDAGDTFHRDHPGWGRIKAYTNNSGRNDIVECKMAADNSNLYCYVKTAAAITPATDPDWMKLFLQVEGQEGPAWEGFQYMVNQTPGSNGQTSLSRYAGGWAKSADVRFHVKGNEMEVVIPKKLLGIKGNKFAVQFKWADNFPLNGQAMQWLDNGDAAPNARFKYRYVHQ